MSLPPYAVMCGVRVHKRQEGGKIMYPRSMFMDMVVNNAMCKEGKPWFVPRFLSPGCKIIDGSYRL